MTNYMIIVVTFLVSSTSSERMRRVLHGTRFEELTDVGDKQLFNGHATILIMTARADTWRGISFPGRCGYGTYLDVCFTFLLQFVCRSDLYTA